MTIAYLVGSDARREHAVHDEALSAQGSTDMFLLRTRDPKGYARLQVTPGRAARFDLGRFDTLLNLVTDADQNPKVLANLARLLRTYRGRIINPPDKVLRTTREKVSRGCAGLAHVDAPLVLRLDGSKPRQARRHMADFPFPAILRLAGTHTGQVLGLVADAAEAASLLVAGSDHFLTEFRDFKSADGLYRKYRFIFVGGEIIMRHLLVSDAWNVHAADRTRFMLERPDLVAEERNAIEYGINAFPHAVRAGLAEIRAAIGLDLFGCDCALTDRGVTLFEANATMNFFPLADDPMFAYLALARARAERAFDRLLFG